MKSVLPSAIVLEVSRDINDVSGDVIEVSAWCGVGVGGVGRKA